MTDYVISAGRSPSYPAHYGAHFVGSRATFCETADLWNPSANVLAIPNTPVVALSTTPVTVADSFFGMHVDLRANDAAPGITCKTVRSHDIGGGKGRWQKIQPSDTQNLASWDFVDLDAWVNTHYAAGRDLIFTLFATPSWASARPTEDNAYAYGTYGSGVAGTDYGNFGLAAEPTDMTDWDFYCTTIATRYLGKIKYYEVWNEPNYDNNGTTLPSPTTNCFFTGTWLKLSEMVRRANVAIKAVDPTAKIISPPIQGWVATGTDTSGNYFTGMMAASSGDGGSTPMKNWIDIVGVHLYSSNLAEGLNAMIDRALAVRSTAALTGKEIWDTESALIFGTGAAGLNDTQVCRYLARTLITFASKGISRHMHYLIDSPTYGWNGRSTVTTYWNTIRTLLMGGTVLATARLWDGRVAYKTASGAVLI